MIAFALADVTLTHVLLAVIVLQALGALALRSSWVQAHSSVKDALEEEQKLSGAAVGFVQNLVNTHEQGETIAQLAKDYEKGKGLDGVLSAVLQPKM